MVSLDAARDERATTSSQPKGGGSTRWFDEYRQAIYGAAAAVLLVGAALGLFREQIFGTQEKVVVEKTVVIVDQVEYSSGSDVLVDSPMQPASMQQEDGEQEESPTVIWLFDSEEDSSGEPDEQGAEEGAPAEGESDVGEDEASDGDVDAGDEPLGQPM